MNAYLTYSTNTYRRKLNLINRNLHSQAQLERQDRTPLLMLHRFTDRRHFVRKLPSWQHRYGAVLLSCNAWSSRLDPCSHRREQVSEGTHRDAPTCNRLNLTSSFRVQSSMPSLCLDRCRLGTLLHTLPARPSPFQWAWRIGLRSSKGPGHQSRDYGNRTPLIRCSSCSYSVSRWDFHPCCWRWWSLSFLKI